MRRKLKKLLSLTTAFALCATSIGQYPTASARELSVELHAFNPSNADGTTTICGQETGIFLSSLDSQKIPSISAKRVVLPEDQMANLISGTAIDWIDRVAMPQHAYDAYDTLVEASDNDGIKDYMIDENCLTDIDLGNNTTKKAFQFKAFSLKRSEQMLYVEAMGVVEQMNIAFYTFDKDHPEVFWYGRNFSTAVNSEVTKDKQTGEIIEYTYNFYYIVFPQEIRENTGDLDYTDIDVLKDAISIRDQAVDLIVDDAKANSEMSIQKEFSMVDDFENYLLACNTYSSDTDPSLSNTSYSSWKCLSALLGNENSLDSPVCEGYARAFKVLCDKAGIPCVLATGDASNGDITEAHMWNYVNIPLYDTNYWYAVDVTWDDTLDKETADSDYFLSGSLTKDPTIEGKTFSETHKELNKPSGDVDFAFTNGPVLSEKSYWEVLDMYVNKKPSSPTSAPSALPNTTKEPVSGGAITSTDEPVNTKIPGTAVPTTNTPSGSAEPDTTSEPTESIAPSESPIVSEQPNTTVIPTAISTLNPTDLPTSTSSVPPTVVPTNKPVISPTQIPSTPTSTETTKPVVTSPVPTSSTTPTVSPTVTGTPTGTPTVTPTVSTFPAITSSPTPLYDKNGKVIGYSEKIALNLNNIAVKSSNINFTYDASKNLQSIEVNMDYTPTFGSNIIITNSMLNAIKAKTNGKDFDMVIRRVESGKILYTLNVSSDLVKANAKLHVVKTVNGTDVLYNSKTYQVLTTGGLSINLAAKDGGTYTLISAETKKVMVKNIKKTISLKKTTVSLKKKKSYKITAKIGINMANVKSVTYKSTNKKIATVSSKGKITAKKKAGKCSIKVTYTLKDGSKKVIKVKVTVKK